MVHVFDDQTPGSLEVLPMVPAHIKSAADLRTPYAHIQAGFLAQAEAKGKKAVPYIKAATALKRELEKVGTIDELAATTSLHPQLFAAAGFSDKSGKHLGDEEKKKLMKAVLAAVQSASPGSWREELVFRFLLTRGDSLGGSMRNWVGAEGSKNLAQALQDALERKKITPTVGQTKTGKVTAIQWANRALLVDKKAKLEALVNNIDVHLLNTKGSDAKPSELMKDASRYLACGELKAGIDPAGADEHWKTGNSAIGRIRSTFAKAGVKIRLFLVAAAIEKAMAEEIYKLWQEGQLDYAANLTVPAQMKAFADWLTSLS